MVPVRIYDFVNNKSILMIVEPKETGITSYEKNQDIEPFLQQYFLNKNYKYAEVNLFGNGFNIVEQIETDFHYD